MKDIFGGDHSDVASELVPHKQFEVAVRRELERDFSPDSYRYAENHEVKVIVNGAPKTICPDLVISEHKQSDEDAPVACVVDAKLRKVLAKRDAEKVAEYGEWLRSQETPRIYVPEDCHIESGALHVESEGKVAITILGGILSGGDSPLEA